MNFPFDLFDYLFQGNWIAWGLVVSGIINIAIIAAFIFVWWKMPQLAKRIFVNETVGGHNPIVAQCFETRLIRFLTPQMTRGGFAYDGKTGATFIPPKMWSKATDLSLGEQNALENIYGVEGSRSPLFLNYSVQAFIANPELTAILQNHKDMKQLATKGAMVSKSAFIDALQRVKGDFINLKAIYFTFPIDIKHLRTALEQSITQGDFVEFENKIRLDERGNQAKLNLIAVVLVLNIITLVALVALHFLG